MTVELLTLYIDPEHHKMHYGLLLLLLLLLKTSRLT